MKKVLFRLLVLIPMFSLVLMSCEKDKSSPKKLSKDIQNIVPDSTLNKITSIGMRVNKGLEPPNIEDTYVASPFELLASNFEDNRSVGYIFSDYYFRLYDQNDDSLTIKLDYYNGGESGTGLGGFLSGDGNNFSVFVEVNSEYNGYYAKLIHIISGTKTEDGIKNLYFANFMLDNYGDEGDYWIENEQGRVVIDNDGISPTTTYVFKSTQADAVTGVSSGCR